MPECDDLEKFDPENEKKETRRDPDQKYSIALSSGSMGMGNGVSSPGFQYQVRDYSPAFSYGVHKETTSPQLPRFSQSGGIGLELELEPNRLSERNYDPLSLGFKGSSNNHVRNYDDFVTSGNLELSFPLRNQNNPLQVPSYKEEVSPYSQSFLPSGVHHQSQVPSLSNFDFHQSGSNGRQYSQSYIPSRNIANSHVYS